MISHTPHYRTSGGQITGWSPTVIENDYISAFFTSTTILGFFHPELAPGSARPYRGKNIQFKPLPPSGGSGVLAKLKLAASVLTYLAAIRREIRQLSKNDWIYVRCPCNIGFIACFYLMLDRKPNRWFKYAGNWKPTGREPLSYTLQRKILEKGLCGGQVTVNGHWPEQPAHVHSFKNACLTEMEYIRAGKQTFGKVLKEPLALLFAGRVEREKGIFHIIDIASALTAKGVRFHISVIGSGKDETACRRYCHEKEQDAHVEFLGELPKDQLWSHYTASHAFLFPSTASEGWPKVLSEAMACRCVPLASRTSSIPQVLREYGCGESLPLETNRWADQILRWLKHPETWLAAAENGHRAAGDYSYEAVTSILGKTLGLEKQTDESNF